MLSAKVATVEDYDSQVQEVVPQSRIQAFKKRQSGLASVTNYSDAGTVDSGYSSNSAPNGHEEQEIFTENDSPSRHTPQSDLSDSNISERTPVNRPLGLESEGRSGSRASSHRTSGKYAFVPGLTRLERIDRPLSRSQSKSERASRASASPAIRPADADDCDCPHCAKASSSAQPSPSMPPPDSGLESSWTLDMSTSLPAYHHSSLDYGSGLLSSSPGKGRLGRENNGFFETFPTTSSSGSATGRPSSLLSSSNPLAGLNTYEYSASPSTYTPSSTVNPLISPPPYLGVEDPASWMPPSTPTSLRGRDPVDDYLSYPGGVSDYNLYGTGPGALSGTGSNHNSYDLPPRSASVQPTGLRNRPRSSTYHVDYPMGPPTRRSSKPPAGPKRIHSANNSYDARYDASLTYPGYDSTYDAPPPTTGEDYHAPPHPINRRLSRAAAGPGALPPLDITRATSVPPADNYVAGIERARRMTSMTPQPLAIANRERNRRGSNASSGLSSSASRRAHEARLAEMIDSVKVEPRPELALAKRESTGNAIVKHGFNPADYDYATDGTYGSYDNYPYENSGMELAPYHHEDFEQDALVLSGHSEPFSSRYGLPPKPHYGGGDPFHRSIRMNSDRRKSMHRRLSDYQHGADPYGHGGDLDELRQMTKSRNSGLDRRLPPNPAYIEDTY
ncbi:hypothetical protein TWF696_005734 [Orbilia brochopaga]|uniref:Uncharacterized protein n=1 Tax=Orbilia brochopaga TaxID=3140254 RepID=A0AAV9V0J2_9PEZI